ncbi:hypothetical protein V8C86DRAFT_2457910 [Haematococcus lacustris]
MKPTLACLANCLATQAKLAPGIQCRARSATLRCKHSNAAKPMLPWGCTESLASQVTGHWRGQEALACSPALHHAHHPLSQHHSHLRPQLLLVLQAGVPAAIEESGHVCHFCCHPSHSCLALAQDPECCHQCCLWRHCQCWWCCHSHCLAAGHWACAVLDQALPQALAPGLCSGPWHWWARVDDLLPGPGLLHLCPLLPGCLHPDPLH